MWPVGTQGDSPTRTLENGHALVVGIANYQRVNRLPPTVLNDAQEVHKLLTDSQHCAYPPGNVQLLLDGEATQAALRQALAGLAQRCDVSSTVLIYFSGHGGRVESGLHAGEYLLPSDVEYTSGERLAATALSGAEFTTALRAIPARKVVVIFDCCHAAGIGQPKDAMAPILKTGLPESYYEALQEGRGRVILASSRSDEYSYVLPGAEHSLFTQHLLAGLRGGAPGPGGVIRIFDLFAYVQPRVTADQPNQHPLFKAEIEENFALALYPPGKVSPPAPPAPLDDGYEYDVFVSYSGQKAERNWVRRILLPRLEAASLRVWVDFLAPPVGPKISHSEHAIQRSRYTLVVLSQAYLDSSYAEFENVAAQYLDLEQSQHRLLPVMIEDCTPRLGLRLLPILDLSDADEFEMNIERVIYQLRRPPLRRGF